LYSKKQLRDAYFYREQVEAHVTRREVLQGGAITGVVEE